MGLRPPMISLEHAGGSKRKRPFSRNTRGGGGSGSRARRRKRMKSTGSMVADAAPHDRAVPVTTLNSRRESRSVSIRDQAVCFADGGGEGPEYMQHFSKRRRERRPTPRAAHVDPRQSSAMIAGSEDDSEGDSSAVYSSCGRDLSGDNSTCSDSQSSSDAEARAREMICRRRSGAAAGAGAGAGAGAVDSTFFSERGRSRVDAVDRIPDLFTAEGETRRLAERARRCVMPCVCRERNTMHLLTHSVSRDCTQAWAAYASVQLRL
eukprot:COSAG02_NODE_9314_length_2258_cov_2.900880_2_plen_264_part_00